MEAMEAVLNRLVNNWDIFSIWVTNQPTFVEVAFGIGLFYVVLQIVRAFFKVIMFFLSGLFSIPRRFKKQKDMRVKQTPPQEISYHGRGSPAVCFQIKPTIASTQSGLHSVSPPKSLV